MPSIASHIAFISAAALMVLTGSAASGQSTQPAAAPALHPALLLVGDSIVNTGSITANRGPLGWGAELIPQFDSTKIHVYNEGRGGRSSRSYIEEGLWAKVLAQLQPGDFVIIQFGHNDSANSQNYPDRITVKGSDDQTQEIVSPVNGGKETIHTYGWYLRQYIKDASAKGASVIICSPPPRNMWADGKIKRGFNGFVQWASDAAKAGGALFIDLNALSADRFDGLGQEAGAKYFADTQHTTKAGAQLNADAVVEGIKQLKTISLADALLPTAGKPVPPATSSPQ